MKSPVRFIVCLVLAFMFEFNCSAEVNSDSDCIYYDFTSDFSAYAEMVAKMDNSTMQMNGLRGDKINANSLSGVLCRTEGKQFDFTVVTPDYIVAGPDCCYTLYFADVQKAKEAVSILIDMEGIRYAELDCEVYANANENEEPHSFHSYAAEDMHFAAYLNYVAQFGAGKTVIAVVDSGVFPHRLIEGKIEKSGYDYIDLDNDATNDMFGHGTNVAGIVADCTTGVPVSIYPIRVLDADGGGKLSNVINAVREAVNEGVEVINLSLASENMSEALDEAIADAINDGTIVVIAAGNQNRDTSTICPAHLDLSGAIVVGSAENDGGEFRRASYSNYGNSVDMYVYGTNITCCSRSGGYTTNSGTSMAAPHVSALAALMRLIHSSLSPGQVESRIKATLQGNDINLPDLVAMIPAEYPFSLCCMTIGVGENVDLRIESIPQTACEAITLYSSDERIVKTNGGTVLGSEPGQATVTAECFGMDSVNITVDVVEEPSDIFQLPESLTRIEDEAFSNLPLVKSVVFPHGLIALGEHVLDGCDSLRFVSVPSTVTEIGDNCFSSSVILCESGTNILEYAKENKLQYIIQ